MKNMIILSLAAVLILTFEGCKKSEVTSPPSQAGVEIKENSFPKNEGTNYKYYYLRTDSTGQSSGTRITYYKGESVISGPSYKIQIDSSNLNAVLQVDSSYFRTTTNGLYYFIDTTGFATSLEDSTLIQFLPFITIDNELLAYLFSLQVSKSWTVFKMNLNYPGWFPTTLVDVSADVIGEENITLDLIGGAVIKKALNIKYTMVLKTNPLLPTPRTFTANAWLVPEIGPAKWEGNGTLVNVFTGRGIDFADTASVVQQSLIDYEIK